MDRKLLGERLKLARVRKNMNQMDLVVALEDQGLQMSQSTIGKIERGERNLYVHQLVALTHILDISLDWAVHGGDISVR